MRAGNGCNDAPAFTPKGLDNTAQGRAAPWETNREPGVSSTRPTMPQSAEPPPARPSWWWTWLPSPALQRVITLGYLRQRWARAGLIIASVALGVATLVATRTLNETLTTAAEDAVNPLTRNIADLLVVNGMSGVPAALVERVAQQPGVQDAQPLVMSRVAIPELDNRSVLLIGVKFPTDFEKLASPGEWQRGGLPPGLRLHPFFRDPRQLLDLRLLGRQWVVIGDELAAAFPREVEAGELP